ncbi:LysR family transcriptional regulator [Cupriavidus sp. 2MCAB6]
MPKASLDLQLLRILHTLLTACSVSRTAVLLGQSRPAIRVALRRMREMTGDPLLVRSGSRMVPTTQALAMIEPVASAGCAQQHPRHLLRSGDRTHVWLCADWLGSERQGTAIAGDVSAAALNARGGLAARTRSVPHR